MNQPTSNATVAPTTVAAAKPMPAKAITTVKETPKYWKKDSTKRNVWRVFSVPNCDKTPLALKILKDHGEQVMHEQYNESTAQTALGRGLNYSPCIYLNERVMGSLGELESYYNKNFFSTIAEGTK
jgi:hypothetical protein